MTKPYEPSRRDFLAASALGLAGLGTSPRVPLSLSGEGTSPPDPLSVSGEGEPRVGAEEDLLYVGTYTDHTQSAGIYLLRMDRQSGQLRSVGSADAGANPSFLAIHPNDQVLYAVNEVAQGKVVAFTIAGDSGALTRLDEQPSGGNAPCYVSTDMTGRVVLVANYESGTVGLIRTRPDGTLLPLMSVDLHVGQGPNRERQSGPHAHCAVADPSNRFVLSADLGADHVFVNRLDAEHQSMSPVSDGHAAMRPGAGPRHLVFHPTLPFVFVANELDSTVATLRLDAERGVLSMLETQSTLPAGWTGTNYPADIHIAPSGRTVYVSNRGHNSIAVFSVAESGTLALVQVVPTDGDWPRNFSLDPTGRWLLVANQRTNSIVVFGRDEETGKLTSTSQRIAIPSPVCLRFHAHA